MQFRDGHCKLILNAFLYKIQVYGCNKNLLLIHCPNERKNDAMLQVTTYETFL